ncbi:MAG: hypothetical protein KJO79_08990 [Verrucomicrobiae bacterium]|nr:hypothetical protein [Verrucomicrobiae bacterium]NNJ87305.1 hypothetical protein [Akkermansiaceae bacterium]
MAMKIIFPIVILMIFPLALTAGDKDVWYDANGKVVKITPAEKEKKIFVPNWKKQEQQRHARMAAQKLEQSARSRSSRTQFWDPYAAYYPGYAFYSPYYYQGWSCRPSYHWHRRASGYHRPQPRFHFQGSYQKNGWSVRVGF